LPVSQFTLMGPAGLIGPWSSWMHLDLNVSETRRVGPEEGHRRVDAAVERLVSLGATRVRACDENGQYWTVMRDPEGNEFCVH